MCIYKTIFVLPVPIEVHFIIFRYEHRCMYKHVLEELLDEKCPRHTDFEDIHQVLEHTHSHYVLEPDLIICYKCNHILSKSYLSKTKAGSTYASINTKFGAFDVHKAVQTIVCLEKNKLFFSF